MPCRISRSIDSAGKLFWTITLLLTAGLSLHAQKTQSDPASAIDEQIFSSQAATFVGAGSARVNITGQSIQLQIDNPQDDSSLNVKPKNGAWDLSDWSTLAVDVTNRSTDRQMRLVMVISGARTGPKKREWTVGIALNPGETRTMRMPLPHEWLFGAPDKLPGVKTLDTARITDIQFLLQWPFESPTPGLLNCTLSHLRTEGRLRKHAPFSKADYVPFIDRYGQYLHTEWHGKIHSDSDLKKDYAQESKQLKNVRRPRDWDQYGGWATGPQLKTTGSFRTEKYNGKWYFVDPAGHLFISQAVDVAGATRGEMPTGKDVSWFNIPLAGRKTYDPVDANLRIKYGNADYEKEYQQDTAKRLAAWGFNSLGDWSSTKLIALGSTPYTLQLTDYDDKMPKIGNSKLKFYDVFDPRYVSKMKNLLADRAASDPVVQKSLHDPFCIGYFIDNELNFGNRKPQELITAVLSSSSSQAIKQEFARDLEAKYSTIAHLNTEWNTSYKSWAEFLDATAVPTSKAFLEDADVFFKKVLKQYFSLARNSIKSVAPDRLYLGVRFISTDAVRPQLEDACRQYCDVLSVNIYAASVANFPSENFPDMPVLITEFQFGILQRGMFSASLCQAGTTPQDRALAYERFVQGALVHPNIVGTQWFQYRDQPLTGRGDGENYQIGIVDGTDQPYPELTQTSRIIAEHMYSYRQAGKLIEFAHTTASGSRPTKSRTDISRQ